MDRGPLGYVRALDGVRGVAILLVIGRHYWLMPHGGGGAGVNLFFVLSGFLITTLLLERRWPTLPGFYAARARRLLPALAVSLAAYLVGAAAKGNLDYGMRAVASTGFYTANVVDAYFPHAARTPIPLWSLAVEEQFYLLWPVILIGLLRLRLRRRALMFLAASAIVAGWAWRIWLTAHGAPFERIAYSPDTHSDSLLTGVLLAFFLQKRRERDQGLAVLALFAFATVAFFGPIEAINGPWVDIGSFGILLFVMQDGSWLASCLSWRPLVWVGRISYSLYLWHLLTLSWIGNKPIALLAAVVAAWFSTRFVEQPLRRRRRRGAMLEPAVTAAG